MRKLFLVFLFLIFIYNTSYSQNVFELVQTDLVSKYYESGDHEKEVAGMIVQSMAYFNDLYVQEKSAVVFDIDETCLSNFPFYKGLDYKFSLPDWQKWVDTNGARPIYPVQDLYNLLVTKGFKIIFITGRPESEYSQTFHNLKANGFYQFDTLVVKTSGSEVTAGEYKSKTRDELVMNSGYKVVGNVGDQWSNLEGGNSGYMVRIPNYIYLIK